jgi:hypothetical protein
VAVSDTWRVSPEEMYLERGKGVLPLRPYFQGDVFEDVPLPVLPQERPAGQEGQVRYGRGLAMLYPHPCQSYRGDQLRPYLTVARVRQEPSGSRFRPDFTGKWACFPLEDLLGDGAISQAELGELHSLPSTWFEPANRIACLSHVGVGLLHKRLLIIETRQEASLSEVMASLQDQWQDIHLWAIWNEVKGTLSGYEKWKREPQLIAGCGTEPVKPKDVIELRFDQLSDAIRASEL